ncbi:hypothetical protein OSTOST_11547, partial [Ostertagia ostertagi]
MVRHLLSVSILHRDPSAILISNHFPDHSVQDIMGRSTDDGCSSACPTCCHDRSKQPCGSHAPSQLLLNTESIRISEAYPDARCTSLSESLTLENDVYESDSEEDSEKPRRKPYTAEPSSSSNESSSSSDDSSKDSTYSHIHWVTSSGKSSGPINVSDAECAALHELQDLESFFGIRNTPIDNKATSE